MLDRVWRKGNSPTLLPEGNLVPSLWILLEANSMKLPQKTRTRTIIWSSKPIPGYISGKKMKALIWKYTCTNSSTIYNYRDMEATQVPTNRWMDKEIVVHIYSGIVHTHILHIHMYIIYTYICCSPWSRKGSGTTEWLAWTELKQKRWEHEKKTR